MKTHIPSKFSLARRGKLGGVGGGLDFWKETHNLQFWEHLSPKKKKKKGGKNYKLHPNKFF